MGIAFAASLALHQPLMVRVFMAEPPANGWLIAPTRKILANLAALGSLWKVVVTIAAARAARGF
ncbi:hypothetical protein D3C81_2052300 [compost metagenome]